VSDPSTLVSPAGHRAVAILHDLIAIPSVNPAYDTASDGEAAVTLYVAAWARTHGLAVERQTVFPTHDDRSARDNVRVRLMGPAGSPTLLFEAHMDTVSPDAMPDPFTPVERNGRLHGRGACDTKGSLAAMMAAVETLAQDDIACTIELLAAVDEETRGSGVAAYVRAGNRPDAAIVGEPTELAVIHAHNGCLRGEIHVIGRAAHTSVAHEGINAIEGMADVVKALAALNREIAARPGGPAENGSLTVSIIHGGTGLNIVPERCTIAYDRRTTPGQTSSAALAEIDAALDTVRTGSGGSGITIVRDDPSLDIGALFTPVESPIVQTASAANGALGLDPTPARVPYGSDASTLQHNGGVPTIVYGPGSIAQAHGPNEYVELDQVRQAAAFYVQVARSFGS
jgi:acetylornithine deacetylase/succinyl-diaminopimelate desuccinylase family protein